MLGTSKVSSASVAHTNLDKLAPKSAEAPKTDSLSNKDKAENLMLLSSWLFEGGSKPDRARTATFLAALKAMLAGKKECVVKTVPDIHFLKGGFTFNTRESSSEQEVSRVTAAHSAAQQELSRLQSMKPAGGTAIDSDTIRRCQEKLSSLERELQTFSVGKK
ncbi:MAG: hypothetical protein H7255_11975 [Ramlibacter sp.]|nr:hypothetical protein [Ramlibacter sp.]